ncbi:MAG: hypothetical protein AVDCRST_MAG57-3616 [uncultured Blastococcus sp.]|uniref:SLH domain-containing protein n=1 Tax=uncultured Blastococcus sp. TaxID=217144 RepID=A0A6J4JHG2_9ACTN|nr:MAG: hypothetical protein AVDCRST_MAG57-3616 [uncultured Blastococcus sp.]
MRIPLTWSFPIVAGVLVISGTALAHTPAGELPESEQAALMEQARALLGPIAAAPASEGEAGPGDVASDGFELVGHDPLLGRGMNAALAVHGDHAYVGSRTDGQPQHESPGILVVDVSDPAAPEVVHEIGRPDAAEIGETSRELRIWPEQDLLMVLNFGCSSAIHACASGEARSSRVTFFDIAGEKAAAPELVATYEPTRTPHEFYLWVDPAAPAERAMIFQTTPTSSKTQPNMIVTDISNVRDAMIPEAERFPETKWFADFDAGELENGEEQDRRLHSMGISNDGKRAYLSFLGSGFLVLDTSEVVTGAPEPSIQLITPPENRVVWTNPGAHSSVKIPGKDAIFVTDEVYGDALDPITGQDHGCPWGWVRTIDISNPAAPAIMAEYKQEENDPAYCESGAGADPANTTFTSYSAHNPTLTPDLALLSWHSAGLEAVDISDPAKPVRAGTFKPEPLPSVTTEDPALSAGQDKVVMWSYPIIKDGLVYVVDLRNGLYILKYTGEHADQVATTSFLEGNSNLGDALRYENPTVPRARLVDDACPEGGVPDSGRTDADGNTHERAIECMLWWGIANGQSDTRYDTAGSVSRGQMASLLAGLITKSGGTLPSDAPDAFTDDDGSVHEGSINALAALGVVNGVGGGRFAPEDSVRRGQVAKLLVRGYEAVSERSLAASQDFFSDDNGSTHEQDINRSAAAGFTEGRVNGFEPESLTQRDQMASLLARTLDLLVEEGTTEPKEPEPAPAA